MPPPRSSGPKSGRCPAVSFAVVACNRLGRRDVKVEEELELLWLYDYQPDAAGSENGSSNGLTPQQYYDRLSTQCMKSFRSLARENLLFGSVATPNGRFSHTGAAMSLADFRERWQGGGRVARRPGTGAGPGWCAATNRSCDVFSRSNARRSSDLRERVQERERAGRPAGRVAHPLRHRRAATAEADPRRLGRPGPGRVLFEAHARQRA